MIGAGAAGQERGHFFSPAVVTGAPPETDLLREETFGPVAPIVPVRSLDEAIELANSTRFGLGANVYTRDLQNVVRCLREIKAGTVWFNDPLTDNDAGPFGGFKQSGLGRELGREGLEAFQETKHVHIETEIAPKEWWYPYSESRAEGRRRSWRLRWRCARPRARSGPPWERPLPGRLDRLRGRLGAARRQPAGRPVAAPLYVYRPPGRRASITRGRLPSVYVVQGYFGQLDSWWRREPFEPNVFERVDAMFAAGECPDAIVVFVDCLDLVRRLPVPELRRDRPLPGLSVRRGGAVHR